MRNAKLIVPVIVVLAVAALVGALAARSMSDSHKQAVVKTRMVSGKTLLVNRRGLTLYHLSVERKGHFICTQSACLALWHPLVVKHGTTPTGAKSLSTLKRPEIFSISSSCWSSILKISFLAFSISWPIARNSSFFLV